MLTLGTAFTQQYTASLNKASLYESTFATAGLTSLIGYYYTPINGVPLDYALYTQTALSPSPPLTVVNTVVGLFIPQAASNDGDGACLFLTADASEFTNGSPYSSQYTAIAKAFTNAALDPNGACAQPVMDAPDLWVKLSDPEGLTTGNPAPITLTVGNSEAPGVAASQDGQVDVTLPDNLALVPSSLPPGCGPPNSHSPAGTSFSCPLSAMEPGDTVTFNFDILAANPIPETSAATISALVSQVTGEINLHNNYAALNDIVTADGTPDLIAKLSMLPGQSLLRAGAPATVTLTISNSNEPGIDASSDGQVEVILPSDLHLSSAPPTGCTATDTGFICQLDGLEPGDNLDFVFQVVAPVALLSDTPITAQITNVTREINLSNNEDILYVTSPPPPPVHQWHGDSPARTDAGSISAGAAGFDRSRDRGCRIAAQSVKAAHSPSCLVC
jgi:hypothetical protein